LARWPGVAISCTWLFGINATEIGVFGAFILVFGLENSVIESRPFAYLIPLTAFYDSSPFGRNPKSAFTF